MSYIGMFLIRNLEVQLGKQSVLAQIVFDHFLADP